MSELQLRIELQGAVQQYAEQLMFQNGIPAHIVEDAFAKTLGYVREKSLQEFIQSVTVPPATEKKQKEEEDDN